MKTPEWAENIVNELLPFSTFKHPITQENVTLGVKILWRESKVKKYSTGRCCYDITLRPYKIVITAGSITKQHKWVVLHEIAHGIAGCYAHHNELFYRVAWDLYQKYCPDELIEIKEWEDKYRKMSTVVFNSLSR